MVTNTDTNRPPQWLALHFPDLAEQASLKRLAAWCYQYSSQVCITGQYNSLLLEVAASRRLFGAAETLAKRINTELGQLGHRVVSGIAPTPEAAHLAARNGLHILTSGDIRKSIGALSIDSLNLPATYTTRPGRPAWLLPEPQRCRIDDYQILSGPERIESGWWDGRDCRRDYFVVRDSKGGTLWAFHEYKPHPGWYLHGLFS